jgi:hypothetical protein
MIHPPVFPPHREKYHGEKIVYEALKRLPDEFEVFYHAPLFLEGTDGQVHETEFDFIVADLRDKRFNALLLIESKSGTIKFKPEDQTWTQNGEDQGDLIGKLSGKKHLFAHHFKSYINQVAVGHCFFFSSSQDTSGNWYSPSLRPEHVIDYTGCIDPLSTITDRFDKLRESLPTRAGDDIRRFENLKKTFLRESWFIESLRSHVDINNTAFNHLTERQWAVFRGLRNNPCLLAQGSAGSGKTLLASRYVGLLAGQGQKILFLCFNRYLANKLRNDLAAEENALVETFHSFIERIIRENDIPWWDLTIKQHETTGTTGQFFEKAAPEKFNEIESVPVYDALVIDEGQDFRPEWYQFLYRYVKPNGRVAVFFDPLQDIFNRYREIPVFNDRPWTLFDLPENCRNTNNIRRYIEAQTGLTIAGMPGLPDGPKVKERDYTDITDLAEKLKKELKGMLREGNLNPSEVTLIINGRSKDLQQLANLVTEPYPLRLLEPNKTSEPDTVYYTTAAIFKGMENEAVIIIDPADTSESNPNRTQAIKWFYTQASRAKSFLMVFKAPQSNS